VIVVGIDGSKGAARALRFAAEEARLRQRGLRIVSAWHVPAAFYAGGPIGPSGVSAGEFEHSTRTAAERQVAQGLAAYRDINHELVVQEGHPASVLLEQSADADMLVLGSRGLGGFRGLLLGSVGQECTHHARCPVVIVPHE
jgi:nucleotide-binding universal stress UspA family protein